MANYIVVNNPKDWQLDIPGIEVVAARDYLLGGQFVNSKGAKVFNLCKSYRYQSTGYYVSLLASARGHKAFPNIGTIQEMKSPNLIRIIAGDIEEEVQHALLPLKSDEFTLSIYFGKNIAHRYDGLSQQIFKLFQAPLLRVSFSRKYGKWRIQHIQLISVKDIPQEHFPFVIEAAQGYFSRSIYSKWRRRHAPYDMAILANFAEDEPPSNEKSIKLFVKAAEKNGFNVDLIDKEEYHRIPEFNALFLRETTSVNHHTFRFAQRAQAEGLVVIDDPESILRCTNKVYLAELLSHNNVPAPRTMVFNREYMEKTADAMEYPLILKEPDSAYSRGVKRAGDRKEFLEIADDLLEKSSLIIAQEYMPTEFDWRVGIINREPLYVCRYYMAADHWQIMNWAESGSRRYGKWDVLHVHDAPPQVVKIALKAANLVGDGLYGVDLKTIGRQCYVIEVNDNPSIEVGIEDQMLKDELYNKIMRVFFDRVKKKMSWRE
jgi:glutathione synthase/RimK-type ligase-like ATP-grasp enzyme